MTPFFAVPVQYEKIVPDRVWVIGSCGASSFSLLELKAAAAASRCYRNAVDNAVRSIDDPVLTAVALEGGHAGCKRSAELPKQSASE